ncbi:hypothetical protein CBM2585_A130541 [Cupriavidus taiwanensis]|nr:hypothetical protein CBM2585_A130541 [Cupriavidus taiwanensis]
MTARRRETCGGADGSALPSAPSGNSGLVAEVDATLGQVVGRHFQGHAVAGQDADAVLLHLARSVCPDFNAVFQRDTIAVVRQGFRHHAAKFNEFFLSQSVFLFGSPRRLHGYVSKILFGSPKAARTAAHDARAANRAC